MIIDYIIHLHSNYKEWKRFQNRKYRALSHMNVSNATWFTTGLLVKQGGETYPKSLSGKVLLDRYLYTQLLTRGFS